VGHARKTLLNLFHRRLDDGLANNGGRRRGSRSVGGGSNNVSLGLSFGLRGCDGWIGGCGRIVGTGTGSSQRFARIFLDRGYFDLSGETKLVDVSLIQEKRFFFFLFAFRLHAMNLAVEFVHGSRSRQWRGWAGSSCIAAVTFLG